MSIYTSARLRVPVEVPESDLGSSKKSPSVYLVQDDSRSASPGETLHGDGDDMELMERVTCGDIGAFECLVERYWERTARYARQQTVDPEQAHDVTQEAFSRLWERRAHWTNSGSVRVWLLKTVRNLAINEYRKWKVRSLMALRVRERQSGASASPLVEAENSELREAIMVAISDLSPRRREAFTLFHLQDLSYREVGDIMDVRPQTAANYVQAAIVDLRVSLEKFFPAAVPRRARDPVVVHCAYVERS